MMNKQQIKEEILKEKLVVIARGVPIEKLGRVAQALVDGGVKLLEVTFNQMSDDPAKEYAASMDAVRQAVGDKLCLGAGTVLNTRQLQQAYDAGAGFYLSPNMKSDVITLGKELGMVCIPGAMTPTEIVDAYELGADIIKLFPADDLGYHYIWNLRGPLPHIPLLASGGVNPQTIPLFLENRMDAVGTGASILKRELIDRCDWDGIRDLARQHVDAIAAFMEKSKMIPARG